MNYMLYGKHKDDKSFSAMNLADGRVGVGPMFATLIPDMDWAKKYADKLTAECQDFTFQVREAGKSKIVYAPVAAGIGNIKKEEVMEGANIMDKYCGMNLMFQMRRLDPMDEVPDIVDKLAENNMGAIEFVMVMLQNGKTTELVACDNLGIYGKYLYMFWNDCCERNLDSVCGVLCGYIEDKITKDYILGHLNEFRGMPISVE